MKLFIDTASLAEIREAASWGIIDGVTTNPSLMAKSIGSRKEEGRRKKEDSKGEDERFANLGSANLQSSIVKELVTEICELIDGPVSVEVTALEADRMVQEARELAAIHENVAVKIPMTVEGIKAAGRLSPEGIRTNVTLVFSASQALLAAKAGASFVSPFVGRIDDKSGDGMEVVQQTLTILENFKFATEVIVASVRHPGHVLQAAWLGADIATVPFGVLRKLFDHPLTDLGIERFLADWKAIDH